MKVLVDFFKLASDETRLRILVLLARDDLCVCEISGILGISQPKASKHLAKLRDMGFVVDRRSEKYIFYSINIRDEAIKAMLNEIVALKDRYSQLAEDSGRLAGKEEYLRNCKRKTISL